MLYESTGVYEINTGINIRGKARDVNFAADATDAEVTLIDAIMVGDYSR